MYEMWLKIRSFVFHHNVTLIRVSKHVKVRRKKICFIAISVIGRSYQNSEKNIMVQTSVSDVLDCDSTYYYWWWSPKWQENAINASFHKKGHKSSQNGEKIPDFVKKKIGETYIPPSAMLLCAWLWLDYYWWWSPKWIWPHRARSLPDPASHDRSRRRWSCRSARFCAQSRNGTVAVKGKKKEFKMHEHPLKPVFGAIWTTCAIASARCGEVSIECNLNFPTICCTLYFLTVNM